MKAFTNAAFAFAVLILSTPTLAYAAAGSKGRNPQTDSGTFPVLVAGEGSGPSKGGGGIPKYEVESAVDTGLDFDTELNKVSKYYKVSADGEATFDLAAAKADGASDLALEAGSVAESIPVVSSKTSEKNADAQLAARASGLKIWGNWCGPSYGGGPTKDVLDEQCKIHDECYDNNGYFSSYCDLQIINNIRRKFFRMKGFKQKAAAVAVAAYFYAQLSVTTG